MTNSISDTKTPDTQIPVIFDTDPGIDDAMALIFLNACKQFSLKGITTVFGNASIENCTRNALYLCERFNIEAPVFVGADRTITGDAREDYPAFVHGDDGLANLNASPVTRKADGRSATDFLIEAAAQYPGELVVIAVGRMTNLALAIQTDRSFATNVKEVVIMGGAVDVPGNVTPWAEANIIGDPEAAGILFDSNITVTQVGLDVTMKTIMSASYIETLTDKCGDAGKLLSEITPYYLNFYKNRTGVNGFACHDSSAVAHLADSKIHGMKRGMLSVELTGEERGRTRFSEKSDGLHLLCATVDADRLLDLYEKSLMGAYA